MAINLPPNGSRGTAPPAFLRPLLRPLFALNVALVPLLGDRIRPGGSHLCVLRTLGVRTGLPRQTPLGCFDDPSGGWLVIGSFGGSARHPQWLRNLAKRPNDVWLQIGKRRTKVRATLLEGEERDATWKRIITASPNYAGYQRKTDRAIPIIRLTPQA
jgi:deazaflavin-dependent oxidoreductase (nitroreductase family)